MMRCDKIFSLPAFPVVPWDDGQATFVPASDHAIVAPWAVVVFVVSGGRFLLGRVPRGWCTPSGHIEPGETPENAARREVAEETGAHVDQIEPIGQFVTCAGDDTIATAMVYLAHVDVQGDIPPASEATAAEWFGLDEVPRIYWRWDALMARMFDYALECAACGGGAARDE